MRAVRAWRGGWRDGLSYGALGFPLAFVELPLYVLLPNHYASRYGTPLAWLGAVLLAARLLDAICDPVIGRWADRLFAQTRVAADPTAHDPAAVATAWPAWRWIAIGAVTLTIGFGALFFPPYPEPMAVLAWCGAALVVTYLGFSTVSVIHQAWGARLAGDEAQRARIVAWREGAGLLGVMTASVLFTTASPGLGIAWFAGLLAIGVSALAAAPQAASVATAPSSRAAVAASRASSAREPLPLGATSPAPSMRLPWQNAAFRRLLAIYALNGIASAVPATLVLFFIQDRLQAAAQTSLFLGSYFAAAALAIPVWVRIVNRFGLARTWLASMLLAIVTFSAAALLGAGDVAGFALVCITSGIALGADLTLPSAMLTGVIQRAGHGGRAEGAYMGWWSFVTKLNLALAAGLALPLLQLFGYASGTRSEPELHVLTAAYCGLPCGLKFIAAITLYLAWIRPRVSAGDPALASTTALG